MMINIAVLPGDGIGPEVADAALTVMSRLCEQEGVKLDASAYDFGGAGIDACGDPLPENTLQACLKADGVLLGAVGGPKWDEAAKSGGPRPEQGLLRIRKSMGLFANLRPIQVFDGMEGSSPLKTAANTDILIVRELTGGLYFGDRTEGLTKAADNCTYTAEEVERVARVAFEAAQGRNKRLTSVDKANVLATSRLWRATVERLAPEYPDVTVEHVLVDAMAMHLITRPNSFDVVLTENLFGDILSDEASVIGGSIGLAGSASLGANGPGLYEPIHGSAPDIAGQGKANPIGAILSAGMLLRFSAKMPELADRLDLAVKKAIKAGNASADMGGSASTSEMTKAVLAEL